MQYFNKELAITGGSPVLRSPLPEKHHITKKEEKNVLQVLRSGKLSGFIARDTEEFLGGPWVKNLEERFCDYFNTKFAISMNSATSALYASVYALDICPGDEVIISSYTMSASVAAILACSGVPVFVDVDIRNYCIDADKIVKAITPKTKAIIVVHLFGNPAEMDKIMYIAKKYGLRVIEDCAQAPGAIYQGKQAGRFGDIGIFSLNRHKTIQTGEGGVAVTNKHKFALRLQLIRNHAEDVIDQMGIGAQFSYIGWNYKMTELEASVGAAQITKLDKLNLIRIRNAEYLTKKLKRFSWIVPHKAQPESRCVYYRYPIRYIKKRLGIKRSTLAAAMRYEGFYLNEGYVKPVYLQSIYQNRAQRPAPYVLEMYKSGRIYRRGLCPIAERLYYEELLLSNITHLARNARDIDFFILAFQKIESQIEKLKIYEKEI